MGIEFIQKRNESFIRYREINFERQLQSRDLFSGIHPDVESSIFGVIVSQSVTVGAELWHLNGNSSDSDDIFLCDKGEPVVCLSGDAALLLRELEHESGCELTLRVVDVDEEHGIVELGPLERNKRETEKE